MAKDLRSIRRKNERQERVLGKNTVDPGWKKQEKRLADDSGGRQTRGSGCGADKGDVHFGKEILLEAKYTDKLAFRLDQKLLIKISKEAQEKGLTPALAIEFGQMPLGTHRDWVMVPKSVLLDKTV